MAPPQAHRPSCMSDATTTADSAHPCLSCGACCASFRVDFAVYEMQAMGGTVPDGLALDVTGCAHLFGGEEGLIRAVGARAEGVGLATRLALAGTPEAARALARFGPGGIYQGEDQSQALRRLPVAALEVSDKEIQALSRAGLKTLAHLADRPTAPIAARFGTAAATRQTQLVEDVHAFPGHIACDSRSASEIVVPVFDAQGELIAVFDVDATTQAAFDAVDQAGLERLMAKVFAAG